MSINFYTPSRVKNYLNCKHIIFFEANKNKLGIKKKDKNISDLKRLEKGNLHEDEYYKYTDNIKRFICSNGMKPFLCDTFANTVLNTIENDI